MSKRAPKQIEMPWSLAYKIPPTVEPTTWAEARAEYKRGPVVTGPSEAKEYFSKFIGGKTKECFLVMFLDSRNHVLDCVCMQEGTVDHTVVYPREVFKKALLLDATGIVLSHNHPAGSLEPSEGDKALTRKLKAGAQALDIAIHDHIIVTHEGHYSFRQSGFFDLGR